MAPQQHPTKAYPGSYRVTCGLSGLCIRLHSVPAATGIAPEIVARRCTPEQASHFPTLEAAMAAADRFLPGEALHFVRVPA